MKTPGLDIVFQDTSTEGLDSKDIHEKDAKEFENQQRKQLIRDLIQNREQRKKYAGHLFCLIVLWLFTVGMIVLLQGFFCIPFELSVAVMIALVSSTIASVLGLFTIVAKYLFPER